MRHGYTQGNEAQQVMIMWFLFVFPLLYVLVDNAIFYWNYRLMIWWSHLKATSALSPISSSGFIQRCNFGFESGWLGICYTSQPNWVLVKHNLMAPPQHPPARWDSECRYCTGPLHCMDVVSYHGCIRKTSILINCLLFGFTNVNVPLVLSTF